MRSDCVNRKEQCYECMIDDLLGPPRKIDESEYDPDCSACKAEATVNRQSYELAQLGKQNFIMKNALETISATCGDSVSRILAERILKIIGKPL